MAKRRTARHFVTKYPNHHIVVDAKSRSLTGKGRRILNGWTNRLFRKLGELDFVLDTNGDVIAVEVHTVVDDRAPAEMIGRCQSLMPLWHGRA